MLQLFRRVAAALPGMDSTENKPPEDSILFLLAFEIARACFYACKCLSVFMYFVYISMHDFMIFLNHILPTISLLCCRACLFSFRSVPLRSKKNFCLCLCLSMPRKKTMYLPHNSARSRAQGFTERNQGPGRRMRLLIINNYRNIGACSTARSKMCGLLDRQDWWRRNRIAERSWKLQQHPQQQAAS